MAKKKKESLNDDFLTELAIDEFNRAASYREQKVQTQWNKDSAQYESKFYSDKKAKILKDTDKLFIPKTYSTVDRVLVDFIDTFFFDDEEIVSVSSWKNIPSQIKDTVKALLNYRLNGHPIDFYNEVYEFCQDGLRNSQGVFKIYPTFPDGVFHPQIECVPFEDLYLHPSATWKNYFKFPMTHRMRKSLDYLKRKGYKNLDQFEGMEDASITDETKLQRLKDMGSPFASRTKVSALGEVYIYEIWTYLDVNKDGFLESCSYLMGGDEMGPKFLIRGLEENDLPYKFNGDIYNRPPFIIGYPYPESHKAKGKSLPEQTSGLQREANAIRNQRREATALALRPPTLFNKSAGIDLMALVNRKMASLIGGDDISTNAIREMEVKDPTSASIYEEQKNDQNFYEITSVPPDLQGMPSKGDDTATEFTGRSANANKKIAKAVKNMAKTGIIPAMRYLLRLEQKFESDTFINMVTARTLGWFYSDDNYPPAIAIQGEFDLTVNIGINKQAQLNKWAMLLDRVNQVNQVTFQLVQAGVAPIQQVHFMDSMKILHKMMAVMGEKNYDEFKINAQQPPMMLADTKGIASQPRVDSTGSIYRTENPEGDLIAY